MGKRALLVLVVACAVGCGDAQFGLRAEGGDAGAPEPLSGRGGGSDDAGTGGALDAVGGATGGSAGGSGAPMVEAGKGGEVSAAGSGGSSGEGVAGAEHQEGGAGGEDQGLAGTGGVVGVAGVGGGAGVAGAACVPTISNLNACLNGKCGPASDGCTDDAYDCGSCVNPCDCTDRECGRLTECADAARSLCGPSAGECGAFELCLEKAVPGTTTLGTTCQEPGFQMCVAHRPGQQETCCDQNATECSVGYSNCLYLYAVNVRTGEPCGSCMTGDTEHKCGPGWID